MILVLALAVVEMRWEVTAAPRDPAVSNPQAQYRADDPRLVGRLVALTHAGVAIDGVVEACAAPARATARTSLGAAVAGLIAARARPGYPRHATPGEFGVRVAAATPVTVRRLTCAAARGPARRYTAAALIALPDGRSVLWLRSAQDHFQFLRPAGPVRASFSCARAASASERAICADPVLANWDRSVAAAFRLAEGDADAQRAWLAERDACGAGRDCLLAAMSLRVDNLLH